MRHPIASRAAAFLVASLILGSTVQGVAQESPAAPTDEVVAQETADHLPPNRLCPTDRKLPRTMRYTILPLHGDIIDPSVLIALKEVNARHSNPARINTLVIEFGITGGDNSQTLALAAEIAAIRKRVPIIGVLGSAVGPGAILPLLCDYLVILDPASDKVLIDWTPGGDVPHANVSAEVGRFFEQFQPYTISPESTGEVVRAMVNPNLDLYLWRTPENCLRFGTSAPADTEVVKLSSGTDALTGLSGNQLITAGFALQGQGGIDSVGTALGAEKWIAVPGVADKVLAQVKSRLASERKQADDALRTGFRAVKDARSIVAAMVEAESIARASDPRKQQYRRSYSREWSNSSGAGSTSSQWGFTRVTSVAWQKNVDASITSWQTVLNMYSQASTATSQARLIAKKLAESDSAKIDTEFRGEITALQDEVDALMQQGPALDIKGNNARQTLEWLRANRNNPVF
ncbi:MAG: hypothetical protein EBR10_02860 [Planctomycetes bacterium]|nr:hypothetical protein [Planctomycetota bacterium]